MIKTKRKKSYRHHAISLLLVIILLLSILSYLQLEKQRLKSEIDNITQHIDYLEVKNDQLVRDIEKLNKKPVTRKVIFTNYYEDDSDGSKNVTASGHSTNDFMLNSEGMYLYQGKVVLATANTTRWNRELKEGYVSHELYDELEITVGSYTYDAIVLDVCGACHGWQNEALQRYDIFTVGSVIGKVEGEVTNKY